MGGMKNKFLVICWLIFLSACTRTMKPTPSPPPTPNLTLWPTETLRVEPSATAPSARQQTATSQAQSVASVTTPEPAQEFDRPPTATDAPCRLDTYSDVTIRDGTSLQPGEVFLKIWRFENIGYCFFNADEYYLIFDGGDQLGGPELAPVLFYPRRTKLQFELGHATWGERAYIVYEGEMIDIPMFLQAPDEPGTYRGYWKIVHAENATGLEDDFWVEIRVKEPDPEEEPEQQVGGGWSGAWLNSDPSRTDIYASSLSLSQIGDQVSGFTYGYDGRVYLIEAQVSEDGQTVDGFFGEPWTESLPFQWTLLENQKQFQGSFWPGDFAAGEWCGSRVGLSLPEKCAP